VSSATIRVTMNPGWLQHLDAPNNALLAVLAARVQADATAMVPVDTGALRDSLFSQVEDGVAIVGATEDYAAMVELGTSKSHPQPYLRPALYKKRG
jgi:HK97 gp10 family phage protein